MFKQLSALSALLIGLMAGETTMAKSDERVIVIGAGLAGLSAARNLHDAGYDVVVLEARDRLGGRVWTDRSLGVPLDMGASWIHGIKNNPITQLAEQANAPLSEIVDYDNAPTYDSDGSSDGLSPKKYQRFSDVFDDYFRWYLRNDPKASMQTLIDDAEAEGELKFLNRRQINFLANTEIEHEFSGSADQVSVRGVYEGEDQRGGDVIFPQGYDAIVNELATGLVIETETIVREIDYSRAELTVTTSRGDYTADRVLVTVPLGVLKAERIAFQPQLPEDKRKAIEKLGVGVLNKVWLKFDRVFWEKDQDRDLIQYVSQSKGHFNEWLNAYKFTGEPLLLGFNAAEYGTAIELNSDEPIIDEAMSVLRRIYGEEAPDPIGYRITRWKSDPYADGAYSFVQVGSSSKHRKWLRKPIMGRVFFAGEATSLDYPATTQGAYLSGLWAANKIRNQ